VVPALVFHNLLLMALGAMLVRNDPAQTADIAIVLGGGPDGSRILTAAKLERDGYVPKVLVSGPGNLYGYHECDLAIPFAVKQGYPESYFLHLENGALSTTEEAQALLPELRRLGVKRVTVVTSNYHTRRALKVFRKAAPDLTFNVVAAPDRYFNPESWWHNREARKTLVIEWMKTVASWFGI